MAKILALHLRVLLSALLLVAGSASVRANRGATSLQDEERDKEGDAETPCEVKTVTVSTLPVLRENEFSFTGGASGNVAGGGGGGDGGGGAAAAAAAAAAGAGGGGAGGGGTGGGTGGGGGAGGGGESRLLLFVRTDLPGRISVMDDLDNTALPYFTLEMSGTGEDISQVHWKQQWLENGTLYFHVSMTESELLAQTTQPTAREPAHVLHEHMHLLHISVMGGLIALLLLILLFTLVLYTRHRWCKRRRIPQKSASTEATHEIHYIPSVLLGPQGRDSYRGSRNTHQHGSSVIGMPIRETPILDDYDCDEDDQCGHSLNSTPNQLHNKLSDGKVLDDYGVNVDMSHYQHVMHSSSTGRRRVPSHTRGHPHSPLNKVTLTLITISTCVIAIVYATQDSCPLTVKVTLHVPEHFVADGKCNTFIRPCPNLTQLSNTSRY
uniref:Astrotactin-1/2 N-terminal domain-containing protein n=1 Tax=Acanthochromis polyacanthus TaxID=80966 RepID=A0A3Q1G296_9TELE